MTFEEALNLLKQRKCLRRKEWQEEYKHIAMSELFTVEGVIGVKKCLLIYNKGEACKSWTPNMLDLFAEDWEIIS